MRRTWLISFPSRLSRPENALSDSELEIVAAQQSPSSRWNWNWGSLPVKESEKFGSEPLSQDAQSTASAHAWPVLNPDDYLPNADLSQDIGVEMSNCGQYLGRDLKTIFEQKDADEIFDKHLITYEDFCNAPDIWMNKDVLFRICGRFEGWC